MGTTLILTGVACIVAAIIGGGVKLLQVEFRVVESHSRQYLLGGFGALLVLGGLVVDGHLGLAMNPAPPGANDNPAPQVPTPSSQPNPSGKAQANAPKVAPTTAAHPDAAEAEKPDDPGATESAKPAASAPLSSATLADALRLRLGETSGSIGDAQVRSVAIWLELPEAERRAIRAVRYEFYNATFKSPKHGETDSGTFRAKWQGYGCIEDAAVIATTAQGETRAPFNLCALWRQGRL